MKKIIASILIYVLMGTQAFGFTTNMPNFSVGQNLNMTSLWNPFGAIASAYYAVSDYLSDEDDTETAAVILEEKKKKDSGFKSLVSDAWFGFTDFFTGSDQYQCSVLGSGGTCITCENMGLSLLAPLEQSLTCNEHGLTSLNRQSFQPKGSCEASYESTDPKFRSCQNDDQLKKKHCQQCLEGSGLFPNNKELAEVFKLAAQQRKEKIIEKSFKDYVKIARDAYSFQLNSYREGFGDEFLCMPGKINQIKEYLQDSKGNIKCGEKSIGNIEETMLSLFDKCRKDPNQKNCPPGFDGNIPKVAQAQMVGPLPAGVSEKERPTFSDALGNPRDFDGEEYGLLDHLITGQMIDSGEVGLERIITRLREIEGNTPGTLIALRNRNRGHSHQSVEVSGQQENATDNSAIVEDNEVQLNTDYLIHDNDKVNNTIVQMHRSATRFAQGIHDTLGSAFSYANRMKEARDEGLSFLTRNGTMFGVENFRSNFSKVFQPNYNCSGSQCDALMTYLRFDPALNSALDEISEDADRDLSGPEIFAQLKNKYTLKVKQDVQRNTDMIEEIEKRKIPLIQRAIAHLESLPHAATEIAVKTQLEGLKSGLEGLQGELQARKEVIQDLESFVSLAENNQPIDEATFNMVTDRMNNAKKEELAKRCLDAVNNFAQICKMDNNPEDYKASDLIGLDFKNNELIASEAVGSSIKDPTKRKEQVDKITQMLDKVACYEQNLYKNPNNQNTEKRAFFNLKGSAMSCLSEQPIHTERSQFANFDSNIYRAGNSGEHIHYTYQQIGMCADIDESAANQDPVEVALAMINGTDINTGLTVDASDGSAANGGGSSVVSNPQTAMANTIRTVKKGGSRYASKITSKDVNSLFAAAGKSPVGASSILSSKDSSDSYSASADAKVSKEEIKSEVKNALANVEQSSVKGNGNLSKEQVEAINKQIINDQKVVQATENIAKNDKAIKGVEKQMESIKEDQALVEDGPEKSAMDAKLAELAKQIEELKAQNEKLKSERDREIARIRTEKINEQIAQNNLIKQQNNALANANPQIQPTASVGSSSADLSSNNGGSSDSGAGFSNAPVTNSGAVANNSATTNDSSDGNSRTVATSDKSDDSSSNGLTLNLEEKKLVAQNGQVIASGDDLLIVDDKKVASLKDAKALALSQSKQAFVYKDIAYVKMGEDFVLASKAPNARRQIAEVKNIRQVEELLSFIDNNDPFPQIMDESDNPDSAAAVERVEELIQEDTQKELKKRIRTQYANLQKELNQLQKRMQ